MSPISNAAKCLRFNEFRFASPALNAEAPAAEPPPSTLTEEWSVIDGLRVATVGRTGAPRHVLVFMGFIACVEPFELQRFRLLATTWDARVTVVDAPGYGYAGARLLGAERRRLRRGDFTPVARRMVNTAKAHHSALRRGPVTVVGYSMGASLACAAAADPGLIRVADMVLVEPVATRRWSLVKLYSAAHREGKAVNEYLQRNVVFPYAIPPTERRNTPLPQFSRRDLAHLGFALSRGHVISDLLRANLIQQFPVEIVHGNDSALSRVGDVARLLGICRRADMEVIDIPVAGQHALWHSMPDVIGLARSTLKR